MKLKYLFFIFQIVLTMKLLPVYGGSQQTLLDYVRGSDIVVNKNLSVRPAIFIDWQLQSSLSSIKVRLYLAEDRRLIHPDEKYKVVYKITIGTTSINDSLTVSYAAGGEYTDRAINTYPYNATSHLTILSCSPALMPEDLTLEIQGDYVYTSSNSTLLAPDSVSSAFLPSVNELQLVWDYVEGADRYDVEWLFIDNPTNRDNIAFDFRNATRIQVSNNYYNISLAYPKGVLLYRVRGVGTYVLGAATYPLYGSWSYPADWGTSLPTPTSTKYRYNFPGLELGLNWQYTATYAEEGKRKEVVSFFDGSLRSRQQVTVNNSDSIAIVGESFYDHVGRLAIESMPAPVFSKGMRYYGTNGTNTGNFNGIFEKTDYDTDFTVGNANPFPNNSGTARYYSSANPFLGQPRFSAAAQIPEDVGFTYTHKRYLNDGTNRIHSVSGVGEDYMLKGGHDTRFYYGNPPQMELDRLFGNEAGDSKHYQKMLTVDPNGLVTASYYDMKERLIASVIVGGASNLLVPCKDSVIISSVVEFDDESREYAQTILVPFPDDYTFIYHLAPADPLCDTCIGKSGCISCRYEVIFSLWDPEWQQFIFKCVDTVKSYETYTNTQVPSLDIGQYMLTKKMRLLDMGLEDYLAAYAQRQSSCIEYDTIPPPPCYTVCEEYCMDKWGLDFPDYSKEEFAGCVYECENETPSDLTACDVKRMTLLSDMSPGGQYFDNRRTVCPLSEEENHYDPAQRNDFLNFWVYPHADPALSALADFYGTATSSQLWDSLRVHWHDTIAEIMLKHHPEYPIYKLFCECGDYEAQHAFDSLFYAVNTFELAKEFGLLNPVNYPNWDYIPLKESHPDPFLFDEKCCPDEIKKIRDEFTKALTCYMVIPDLGKCIGVWYFLFDPDDIAHGGGGVSDHAVIDVFYTMQKTVIPAWASGYNCSEDDARWMIFRSIYTGLKEKYRQLILIECLEYKPPFELDQSDFFSDLYPDNVMGSMCEKYLKADTCQNMALTVGESWKGFQIRYRCEPYYGVNMENLDDMVASGTEVLLENCIEDCETFANGWMAELNDYLWTHCKEVFEEDSIKWKEIRTDLIYFCVNGCNESYEHRDFTFRQLIQEYGQEVLGRYCVVEPGAYTRIVYPRPENIPVDCGCNNYQFYLNAYGLTFWSEVEIIKDALALENIDMDIYIIDYWNRFCIWQRYDMLIDQNRDTALWDEYQFPEEFRCRPDSIDWLSECEKLALLQAESGNHIALQEALALSVAERQALYYTHCAKMNEKLTIEYTLFECGYTLYYYDQADNLIRTVPPNGVKPITNNTTLQQVRAVRDTITSYKGANLIRPQHTMVTYYRYTTQDLVTATRQPDHNGETEIYYDILFKPAISRDAKQYPSRYSYTAYDSLGRIRETGQLHTFGVTPEMVANPATLADLIHDKPKSEVTKTYYDKILVTNLGQTRLRNRIAAITYSDVYDPNPLNYQTATHYSYDIHGNVKQLIQNITGLSAFYRDYIYINYEYDLISGNMNQVHYQTGAVEAFSHRYRYDADNRLTHVYTYATDRKELEHNDAQYFYYPHGPLARMELGDKQVQGMDYAYTLQGWLKAINGYKLEKGFDMGSDGFSDTTHSIFGRDVYATMLQYNLNDYRPISGNSNFTLTSPDAVALYNGNISALSTVYTYRDPLLKAFRYDKLNRIRSMQTARLSGTKWDALSQSYATEYTYDLNGNLQTLSRRDEMANYLHNLTYSYTNNTNRLARVYAPELNDPPYRYDAIGNLIQDMGERFDVLWTAANKVKSVIGDRRDLTFSYSPLGQRQIKQTVTGGDTIKEYYIHDATGNVMAVYKQSLWPMSDTMLYITERSIYGSSRIGLLHSYFIPHDLLTDPTHLRLSRVMGERSYELTDHLGNVATTLSDRKIATALLAPNAGFVDYYTAEIENYTDYYPFGFPIKERAGVKLDYRYGFNGQEKDNEIYGYSAMLNFLFRMYDARLGRFWAIDPLSKQYPYNSTYAFAENSPIAFGELEGLERYFAASGVYLGQNGTSHQIRIMNAGAQYQQSKPVDYLTDNSVPFHSASESAQKAVATTMYNVLTNPFPLKEMNVNSKGGGTAASTSPDNHGKMTIYPNATNQGEYINDNYYNQLNVWAHESYHKTNNLSGDGFSEFKVNISQIEHWSFTKTTGIYKEYLAGVMNSNLQEQGVVLRNSSSTRRSDYDNLVNQYNKNVKILNDLIDKYNLESVGKNKEFNPKEYFGN